MLKFVKYVALAALVISSSVSAEVNQKTGLPKIITGPAPLWLDDPSVQFDRVDYLTRRGGADTGQNAADVAIKKLIQLFQFDENTLIDDALLEGIKIKAIWHNTENNSYRAITAMPRKEAELFLRQKINLLDDNTAAVIDARSKANITVIIQLRLSAQAVLYQTERSYYQSVIKKVNLGRRGIPPRWDLKKLEQTLDTLVTGLSISAKGGASNIAIGRMKEMIKRGFKAAGISTQTVEDSDYILTGQLSVSHKPDPSGWMLGIGILDVNLYDRKEAASVGTYQWNIEVTHLYPETAKRRVIERAEYLLKKEMHKALIAIALPSSDGK